MLALEICEQCEETHTEHDIKVDTLAFSKS